MLPSALHPVVFLLLAIHALRGSRETIEAISLLMLSLIGHKFLFPSNAGTMRWIVFLAAGARYAWDVSSGKGGQSRVSVVLVVVSSLWVCLNLLSSKAPMISVLKLFAFGIGTVSIFGCFARTAHLRNYWQVWMLCLATFFVVGSVILLPTPLGYTRTVEGFQGILRHPQTLGPVAAASGALFTGLIMSGRGDSRVLIPLSVASWILVFVSGARTAVLAGGGGLVVAFVLGAVLRGQNIVSPRYLLSPVAVLCYLLGAGAVVGNQSALVGGIESFVLKGQSGESVGELFEESRGKKSNLSMDNFYSSPLVGIGFGVPSDLSKFQSRVETGLFGIPTGASVEKGFMPTAVLEETGIVGVVIVVGLIVLIFGPIHRNGTFETIWVAWTVLLMNVGEAVFYSLGGPGFFMWFMLGFCYNQAGGDLDRSLQRLLATRQ